MKQKNNKDVIEYFTTFVLIEKSRNAIMSAIFMTVLWIFSVVPNFYKHFSSSNVLVVALLVLMLSALIFICIIYRSEKVVINNACFEYDSFSLFILICDTYIIKTNRWFDVVIVLLVSGAFVCIMFANIRKKILNKTFKEGKVSPTVSVVSTAGAIALCSLFRKFFRNYVNIEWVFLIGVIMIAFFALFMLVPFLKQLYLFNPRIKKIK